jgi:hypothetical protein
MTAHYPPKPDDTFTPDADLDILPTVSIASTGVTIGGVTLPASWLEAHGVRVGVGDDSNLNTVTLTFLVSTIDIEDQSLPHVDVTAAA